MADWFSEPRPINGATYLRVTRPPWLATRVLAASVLLMAGLRLSAASPDPGKVTSVRFWSLGDMTRVAVEVSSDFTFKSQHLSAPERLFFDIRGAKPEMVRKGVHVIPVGDALLTQIRVAETQPDVTRVVLDLAQAAAVTTSQLSNPNRLMIELRSTERPAPPSAPSVTGGKDLTVPAPTVVLPALAVATKPAPAPAVSLPPPPVIAPPVETPAAKVSAPVPAAREEAAPVATAARRGDRSLTRALGLKLGRVVLDAGHGGNDVGTHGPSGYLEKDLTLDVTQRLGALLEERLGSEVVHTRSGDTYVGLEERTKIANDRQADLFLSIHANSSPYRSAAGVETYILNFTTSKTALELAARENATSQRSIHELHELVEKIALKDKVEESTQFALKLQTSLSAISTRSNDAAKNRGVKKAPFVVLIGAAMPSVLAEIGFLTNATDEALLRKPEHRQKIAEALYKGIEAYVETLSRVTTAGKN
ncbi:MAG: N-acetylmuramoyl-L-alanine amidase [Bryobacterales bacterium]|nr:N-acetylmuramoyl-L-alanine amidase [Bryobacterales bacterium]